MLGQVKWFNTQKGYGFIAPDSGGADIFVHITDVQKAGFSELIEGQRLSFEHENGKNGKPCARQLRGI